MNILTSLCSYSSLSVVGKSSARLWPVIKTSQISLVLQLCSRGLFIRFFLPPFIHHVYDGRARVYGGRTWVFSSSSPEKIEISLEVRQRQGVVILNSAHLVGMNPVALSMAFNKVLAATSPSCVSFLFSACYMAWWCGTHFIA